MIVLPRAALSFHEGGSALFSRGGIRKRRRNIELTFLNEILLLLLRVARASLGILICLLRRAEQGGRSGGRGEREAMHKMRGIEEGKEIWSWLSRLGSL